MDETSGEPPGKWLTVAAAARQLGVTPRAVRSRIAHGSLTWKPAGNTGKLVLLPSREEAPPEDSPEAPERMAELHETVAELQRQLGHATGQLAGQERLIQQLQDDLAQARQPWWRKLFGA